LYIDVEGEKTSKTKALCHSLVGQECGEFNLKFLKAKAVKEISLCTVPRGEGSMGLRHIESRGNLEKCELLCCVEIAAQKSEGK